MQTRVPPTKTEIFFPDDELIVSKTDVKGRLTYTNSTFCRMAGFSESELLGQPHSIIRHPDMPRAIFKLLWDTLLEGREVFAYVKNIARSGDYYWVFAHVTPSYDQSKAMIGFHSNRRVPKRRVLDQTIIPLYAELLKEEARHKNGKDALAAGYTKLNNAFTSQGATYDSFIFSL
jgi:PAS domain S-box-containing protein